MAGEGKVLCPVPAILVVVKPINIFALFGDISLDTLSESEKFKYVLGSVLTSIGKFEELRKMTAL